LIEATKQGYVVKQEWIHLPADSDLYRPYRALQRVKSLERIQQLATDRTYNFSVTFTADEETRIEIRRQFQVFLKRIEELARKAPEEEVYQINFDLFDWSR
jgi:hypothetical protein